MALKPHFMIPLALLASFGVLALAMAQGWMQATDLATSTAVQSLRSPWLDRALLALTLAGDGWVMKRATLVAVALLLLLRQWRLAALFGLTMLTIAATVPWLKEWFAVARPTAFYTGRQLYSFPSHHAAGSAAFWALCAGMALKSSSRRMQIVIAVAAAMLIVATAISRVYLAAHWPSDVIAGVLFGLAVAGLFLTADVVMEADAPQRRRSTLLIAAAWLLIASWHVSASYGLGETFYQRAPATRLQAP